MYGVRKLFSSPVIHIHDWWAFQFSSDAFVCL